MENRLDMDLYDVIIRSALGLNIGSGADIEFVKESETEHAYFCDSSVVSACQNCRSFKTGMGTPATSVLRAYIFILHFEPRLMNVFYDIAVIR